MVNLIVNLYSTTWFRVGVRESLVDLETSVRKPKGKEIRFHSLNNITVFPINPKT